MKEVPTPLQWFLEYFEVEDSRNLVDNIEVFLNIHVDLTENTEDNTKFVNFIRSYEQNFVLFANDWIEDEQKKQQFINFCNKQRIRDLFDN